MTTRQYIGARYIPVFADPVQWDNSKEYAYLTMVQNTGETYMSKQNVPIGAPLPDISQGEESTEFWVHMSNWNAQIETYRQEVLQYNGRISTLENDLPIADFDSTNTVSKEFETVNDIIGSGFKDSDDEYISLTSIIGSGFDATDTIAKAISDEESNREDQDEIRPIAFSTVADMKVSSDISNGMIVHTNGFHTEGDGGSAWYKISDTGTANEMDVIACGALYAILISDGSIVNVKQLGAYGDNVNDDYSVINYAATVAQNDAKTLYFPEGYEFKIETNLVIQNPIEIVMDSPIYFEGSDAAVTLGKITTSWNKNVKLYIMSGLSSTYYDTTSVGAKLINFNGTVTTFKRVSGFYDNVQIVGANVGCAYNTFFVGNLINGHILLHLMTYNNGWINENLFIGGRITCWSEFSENGSFTGVKIEGNSSHYANNNVFEKPSIEDALNAFDLTYCEEIYVNEARTEGCSYGAVFNTDCRRNNIEVGYGQYNSVDNSNLIANRCYMKGNFPKEITIYDTGYMPDKAFNNGDYAVFDGVFCRLTATDTYDNPKFTKYNEKLTNTYHLNGICIDTSLVKEFTMRVFSGGEKSRAFFHPLDENGNFINTAGTVKGMVAGSFTTDTLLSVPVWVAGSDSNGETHFKVSDACKKLFVGFRMATHTYGFTRFQLTANDSYYGNYNKIMQVGIYRPASVGLNAVPTCEGKAGDFVFNDNVSTQSSTLGWIYNGSAWSVMNR